MHKLGHFVAGEKVGHFVRWDNLSPEKCKLNNGFLIYMPEIWPKIAQDISKICPRYVQALPEVWGFKLRKWDKMLPGRVHKLGHYVAGEVHNALGHFVFGTFSHLTCNQILPSAQAMPGRSIIACLIDVKFSCKAFWINIR